MRPWMITLLLSLSLPLWLHAGEGDFESKGVRLHYTDTGNAQGEPVLLVHGFAASSSLQWSVPGVTKALAGDFRLIMLDNRGHGRSARPKGDEQYGMEMVHDLARLMDHLQIKKAHIVGYSMGAFLTHKFAATYPERVKSIILGGAGWMREGPLTESLTAISESLRKEKSLEPLFRALHPADAPPISKDALAMASKMALMVNDPLALSSVAAGMKQLKLSEEEVKAIKAPTFCIVGDRDPLAESVKLLEGQRPNLKFLYMRRAHHMNAFELPEFREAILTYLKEQK